MEQTTDYPTLIRRKFDLRRFDKKWREQDGHWIWHGAKSASGYGRILIPGTGRHARAHRWIWEFLNGPIPVGKCVLHHCDIPLCVNPDHLFLGTHRDNVEDKCRKQRAAGQANGRTPAGRDRIPFLLVKVVRLVSEREPRLSQYKLAAMFRVNRGNVRDWLCGKKRRIA